MRILISLSAKEGIKKGSRVAVKQGSDYWLATVTRRGAEDVTVQFDEGTKGAVSLRSCTHLPDKTKKIKKPLTKVEVEKYKEAKAAPAKTTRATKAAPAKTDSAKTTRTKITKEDEDSFEAKYKKQQEAERSHESILDVGNVVEYKGRKFHVAASRHMRKRGAGKVELTLKGEDGKMYKMAVSPYSHTLKLVRKASEKEQAANTQAVKDLHKRQMDRADTQYKKSQELNIDHDSVGKYALVKFTNGTKWVKIEKVDASGRIGIQGSGSKLRYIEASYISKIATADEVHNKRV